MIPAARILETTSQFIPTGQAQDVKDSPFDFSTSRSIGAHLYNDNEQLHWNKGYNHCYILKEERPTRIDSRRIIRPFLRQKADCQD